VTTTGRREEGGHPTAAQAAALARLSGDPVALRAALALLPPRRRAALAARLGSLLRSAA
jgi:hypothetical protein